MSSTENNIKEIQSVFGKGVVKNTIEKYNLHSDGYFRINAPIVEKIISINFASRSGSVFLSRLLRNNSEIGEIAETLNPREFETLKNRYNTIDCYSTIQAIVNNYKSSGIYGFKGGVTPIILFYLSGLFNAHKEKTFYVHLQRRNILDQALSIHKARTTNIWHITDQNKEIQNVEEDILLQFNYDDICKYIRTIFNVNNQLLEFYNHFDLDYLSVYYEDLVSNPELNVNTILKYCGVDSNNVFTSNTGLIKTKDYVNDNWKIRFFDFFEKDSELQEWMLKHKINLGI